ncbi:hypothetical protein BKA93DRAFT_755296 [Sparassis latifolia]|uniref:Cytochrome c oxidase subunit 8, mitochondrial n=1 Tax=Sparassis crispa TaxID=139825 RepID=A0A401GTW3_9APHY|nr:hypothetical protein SCP_0801920 [Sparassis crispa]GBE85671.1 hypothetical protein SCP_0801920 [Sparassis crispa]
MTPMSSSSLRMTPLSRVPYTIPKRVRSITASGPHTAHKNMPFSYSNRTAFRSKYIAFVSTGFLLPFIAGYWQLWKSSRAT